jgi:hypothetical protein
MSLRGKLIAGGLTLALLAAVGIQRKVVCDAQANNELLRGQEQTALPQTDPADATPIEVEALRNSIRDLPTLRNEVRQLRMQKQQADSMRAANEGLLAQVSTTNEVTARPAATAEQGFVLNNTWAYAGFAAPEATIQTFFWAVRQQDLQTVIACFTPEIAKESGLVDAATGQLRDSMREQLVNMFGNIQGFRIAHAEQSSADKVKLDIQAAVNGQPLTVSLRHIGQEWKIHKF